MATPVRHSLVFDAFPFPPVMQRYLRCRANAPCLGKNQLKPSARITKPWRTYSDNWAPCMNQTRYKVLLQEKLRNAGSLPCSPRILTQLVNPAAPQCCSHLVLAQTAFHQCPFQCGAGTRSQLWSQKSEISHFLACQRLPTTWTLGSRPWAASFIQSLGISHTCSLWILAASHSNAPPWGGSGSGGITNHLGKQNIYLNLQRGEWAVLWNSQFFHTTEGRQTFPKEQTSSNSGEHRHKALNHFVNLQVSLWWTVCGTLEDKTETTLELAESIQYLELPQF